MFVYGVVAGVVGTLVLLLSIRWLRAHWIKFWSLDRLWRRLERGKGNAARVRQRFFQLAESAGMKEIGEIEKAASRLIQETVDNGIFMQHVMPLEDITVDDLDRQVDTDAVMKVIDREKNGRTIRSRVFIDRVLTPRYVKDIDELRVSDADPRSLFKLLGVDMAKEIDGSFIGTVNNLLCGCGKVLPETGKAQWTEIDDNVNRNSVAEALKRFAGDSPPAVVLINDNFFTQMLSWSRKVKARVVPDLFKKGTLWVITEKTDIVPDGAMYMFGPSSKLGRAFVLSRARLHFDRHAYDLKFFAHMQMGALVALDDDLLARVDFKKAA